MAGAYMILLF